MLAKKVYASPKNTEQLDFNYNAFYAKNMAQALDIVRAFFKTQHLYEGKIFNAIAFNEGSKTVYRFYVNSSDKNLEAFIVF